MTREADEALARQGRRAALVLAGTGLFWIVATWAGGALEIGTRWRALFDLMALAGFGVALWMTWVAWRMRSGQKDRDQS